MRKTKNVMEVRRDNLRLLMPQWGGPEPLANKLQLSNPSYLYQMLKGHRPFSEKTARRYEELLDLPLLWFDQEHEQTKPVLVAVNDDLISQAITAVTAALEDAGTKLTTKKFGDFVTLVYEQAKRTGGIDPTYVQRIVKLLTED